MKAEYKKYQLLFKQPVLTSRGEMKVKNGYFLYITINGITGTGECSFIEGLSADNLENYESTLLQLCNAINTNQLNNKPDLKYYPSINFGLEVALLNQRNGGKGLFFESDFTNGKKGIPINGLIWMGRKEKMLEQIKDKLQHGFSCIKIKVGAISFDEEVSLLKFIRQKFPKDVIEIRLDANGAFTNKNVFKNLETLSAFDIHSIEQPVKAGQFELMKKICSSSPILIALDEELIGVEYDNQLKLLQFISPQYIILKPSLLGGFESANRWITFAEQEKIKWWVTSALESNIGLSAIAQWVATKNNPLMQGLGTGSLYSNNMPSSLQIRNGYLWMR